MDVYVIIKSHTHTLKIHDQLWASLWRRCHCCHGDISSVPTESLMSDDNNTTSFNEKSFFLHREHNKAVWCCLMCGMNFFTHPLAAPTVWGQNDAKKPSAEGLEINTERLSVKNITWKTASSRLRVHKQTLTRCKYLDWDVWLKPVRNKSTSQH